jgi:hypothetical protein
MYVVHGALISFRRRATWVITLLRTANRTPKVARGVPQVEKLGTLRVVSKALELGEWATSE